MADCVLEIKSVIMNRLTYLFGAGPTQISAHRLDLPLSKPVLGPHSMIVLRYIDAQYVLRSADYASGKIVFVVAQDLKIYGSLPNNLPDIFYYGPTTTPPTYDPELLECNYCCANGLPSGHSILPG